MIEEIEFDRSFFDRSFLSGPLCIHSEVIKRYCRIFGITALVSTDKLAAKNAGYRDLVAPATLCALMIQGERPDIGLNFGRRQLFASASIELLVPVCAGDVVTGTTRLKDVYAKTGRSGTMVFIVWESGIVNQLGEKVASLQQSYVRKSLGSSKPRL